MGRVRSRGLLCFIGFLVWMGCVFGGELEGCGLGYGGKRILGVCG